MDRARRRPMLLGMRGIVPPVWLVAGAICAALLAGLAGAASARQDHLSVFGGTLVMNDWGDVFATPQDLDLTGDSLVGVALGRDWPTRWRGLAAGIEGQAVWHFGDGHNQAKITLPAVLPSPPPRPPPLRGLAFGLGLSYASEPPRPEIEKGGAARNTLFYWMIEAEFGRPADRLSVIARLHHRSTGFGTFGEAGSSNYLVLGLRRRF
jgi:hypothetical protein